MLKWIRRAGPLIIAALLGFFLCFFFVGPPPDVVADALNTTYYIDGLGLRMDDGQNFYATGNDMNQGVFTYLERMPVRGVFPDEQEGAAVILIQQSGENRTDAFVAAATVRQGRVVGTNAICLGQDVLVLDVEILDEMIWVHYLTADDLRSGRDGAGPAIGQFLYRKGILVPLS